MVERGGWFKYRYVLFFSLLETAKLEIYLISHRRCLPEHTGMGLLYLYITYVPYNYTCIIQYLCTHFTRDLHLGSPQHTQCLYILYNNTHCSRITRNPILLPRTFFTFPHSYIMGTTYICKKIWNFTGKFWKNAKIVDKEIFSMNFV